MVTYLVTRKFRVRISRTGEALFYIIDVLLLEQVRLQFISTYIKSSIQISCPIVRKITFNYREELRS